MAELKINPAVRESLFFTDGKGKSQLDEGAYAEAFVNNTHLICYEGVVYDQTGRGISSDEGKRAIYDDLRNLGLTTGLSQRVKNLWELVKIQAYVDHIDVPENEIAVQNGTIIMNLKTGDWEFTSELRFSPNRLNCRFDPTKKTPLPTRFLEWKDSTIQEYDQAGFQEYLGYLLLPCTRLQKAMVIMGRGQEGKSRIGLLLHWLFGLSCASSAIEYFEDNRFSLPRAKNKLVLFQDDLKKEKMKSTENFKMMVSAEIPLQAEPKHDPVYSFQPYARWVVCSNAPLTALSDSGHGFFRRLYTIRAKNRPPDRKDDPFYFEPVKNELDGVFIWCLQGLQRLIQNGWKLSISAESQELVESQQEQENSLIGFMNSELAFGSSSYSITKAELYAKYMAYCTSNQAIPRKRTEMWEFFEEQMDNLRIKKSKHLGETRGAEGYTGMCLKSTAAIFKLLETNTGKGVE